MPLNRSFILGVTGGVLLSAAFATGIFAALVFRGVRLRVDASQIAALVQEHVELQARKELPRVVQRLSADAPQALVGRLKSSGGITVRMLDVEMRLPSSVVREVDRQVEQRLTRTLRDAISRYDVEPLVSMVGISAQSLVKNSLENELNGRTFPVRLYPWLTVPVSVEAR